MDDDLRIRLFDPQAAHGLVLARRPPSRSAVACVVSDVVWHEVVVLLRWAAAGTGGTPDLDAAPGPLPLAVLATEVDALGAVAISALAETSPWTVP